MANFDLALDLGSDFISVLTNTGDALIKQHNFVAVQEDGNEILACGNGAVKLFNHNPQKIKLIRPLEECNVKNKDYFDCYFNWLFTVINESAFDNQKARILCVVPSGVNSNEKKILETSFINLGARSVVFTETPKAAQKIIEQEFKTRSGVIADLGSTIADFGCFADGVMTSGCSLYLGGRQFDVGIKQFVESQYNMYVDLQQAEKVKMQCSMYDNNVAHVIVDGMNFENKNVEKAEVPLRALYDVLAQYLNKYSAVLKSMIRSSETEVAEKLKLGGIYLCGGLSNLEGIAEYLSRSTEIEVKVSAYGANAVIYGARLMLEDAFTK